jgi:hypothetical protein
MNGTSRDFTGRSPYDVVGASEGPDIGALAPDPQAFVLQALAAHLDKITAVIMSNPAAPIEQVEFEIDNSLIGAGGFTVKMPTGAAIVSYYIENNSTSTLAVYGGLSPAGRSLNSVLGNRYKVALAPQQQTSLTIVPGVLTTTGLIRIVLTAAVLSPTIGTTL